MNLRSTGKSTFIALIFTTMAGTSTLLDASLKNVELKSLTLSFADLNLTRPQDQQTLYQRLQKAAREVCETRKARTTAQVRHSRQCYSKALQDAVDEIGSAGLLALQAD